MTERGDSCPPPQEEQGTKKRKHLELEEGWRSVEEGIEKLKRILELKNPKKKRKYRFSSEEYINLYTAIYDLCTQQSHACPAEVYQKYCTAFVDYLRFTVLPSLNDKHGEFLLREIVFRWDNHKVMLRWLSRLFDYLDRWYIYQNQLETLAEVALSRFRDEVFNKVMKRIRGVVLEVIDRERDGEEVDRSLLKNVVGLFVEFGCYEKDFELFLVENSIKHYSRKSAKWIVEDSCPEYLRKVEGCLDEERNRVRSYLVSSSKKKVMHYVRMEMLIRNWRQLLEKEDSGVRVLIRDNRVDDLALICKIFRVLKKGKRALDFVFAMFGLCVAEECNVVFPQAEELAKSESQDKVKKNGLGFVDKAFELYGKYLTDQVVGCFENDNNFRLAFTAPFAAFCNKKIDGRPMSELLASYLDSLLSVRIEDVDDK